MAHLAGVTPSINGCNDVCNHGRVSLFCPRIVVAGDQAMVVVFFQVFFSQPSLAFTMSEPVLKEAI
uniref:Uncharacterized protein n=1 Tax=Mesocestoides corti TaxID=53468 RepID=A0A5K3G5Y8_MESCO